LCLVLGTRFIFSHSVPAARQSNLAVRYALSPEICNAWNTTLLFRYRFSFVIFCAHIIALVSGIATRYQCTGSEQRLERAPCASLAAHEIRMLHVYRADGYRGKSFLRLHVAGTNECEMLSSTVYRQTDNPLFLHQTPETKRTYLVPQY